MKKFARIKSYKYDEIFPKEAVGSIVQLLGKERISWSNQKYYRVKYLDEKFRKYNGLCLAGGGRFDDIYTDNLEILEGEKNNGLK